MVRFTSGGYILEVNMITTILGLGFALAIIASIGFLLFDWV